jgi:hypothetical protein
LLQSEIFDSAGYIKYVSSDNGKMDVLLTIADLKQKAITYQFNNLKIKKVMSIQRKRESIMAAFEKVKDKLIRWRKFQRTTMDDQKI